MKELKTQKNLLSVQYIISPVYVLSVIKKINLCDRFCIYLPDNFYRNVKNQK